MPRLTARIAKRIPIALPAALVVGAIAWCAGFIPTFLHGHPVAHGRGDFNRWLPLVWFLGDAIRGAFTALLLTGLLAGLKLLRGPALTLVGMLLMLLLATAVPSYSIISGHYADALTGVYGLAIPLIALVLFSIPGPDRPQQPEGTPS